MATITATVNTRAIPHIGIDIRIVVHISVLGGFWDSGGTVWPG
jgi:hypothetical protein